MQKLGYIYSTTKVRNVRPYIEVTNDLSLQNSGKPFLVVGYNNAKKVYGDAFHILKKKIDDVHYWTFSRTERRSDHEDDIKLFNNDVMQTVFNSVKYYYVDIFSLSFSKIKKLYEILFSFDRKYIYISNSMVYVYYEKSVLGISLTMLKYVGIHPSRILYKLRSNTNNVIYEDDSEFVAEVKKDVGNKRYVIPYLMQLDE